MLRRSPTTYWAYVIVKRLPNYAADDLLNSKNVSLAYRQGEALPTYSCITSHPGEEEKSLS